MYKIASARNEISFLQIVSYTSQVVCGHFGHTMTFVPPEEGIEKRKSKAEFLRRLNPIPGVGMTLEVRLHHFRLHRVRLRLP
jgi:hypothetical protein